MQRYLQVHRFEDELEQEFRASRGTRVAPYIGQAEARFHRTDLARLGSTPGGKRAMQIAIEDEAHFIDFANSAMWLAKERVFIDKR